jgi:hypothetical protein
VLACRVQGTAATQLAILDGRLGCGEWSVACGSVQGEPCSEIACSAPVEPGRWWIFVATRAFQGVPCGTPYRLSVDGSVCAPVAARPSDWGGVKRLYQ